MEVISYILSVPIILLCVMGFRKYNNYLKETKPHPIDIVLESLTIVLMLLLGTLFVIGIVSLLNGSYIGP